MVHHALGMFVELLSDVRWLEIFIDPRVFATEKTIDVVDAFASEPAGVRGAKTLLATAGGLHRQGPTHGSPEEQLAFAGRPDLVTGDVVLVNSGCDVVKVAQF